MTFSEVEKILKSNGWKLKTVNGSHYQYTKEGAVGKVTVPKHGGDLNKKTVNSILKQAGLK